MQIPERHYELLELEARFSQLRRQRIDIEKKLQALDTAWSRLVMGDDDEVDALAEQLATGELDEISTDNLPEQRMDLRARLEIVRQAEQKLTPRVTTERTRHAKAIAAAIRPRQRAAVKAIDAALAALLEANAAERAVHAIVPGALLVASSFPGINVERVKFWRDHAIRLGLLDTPKKQTKGIAGCLVPAKGDGDV